MIGFAEPLTTRRKCYLSRYFLGSILCVSLLGSSTRVRAQQPDSADDAEGPRTWAILIGVGKYENVTPLSHTVNDVKRLANTLVTRGGIEPRCLQIPDEADKGTNQTRKSNLEDKLTNWLAKPAVKDSIIVYFSGYGFKDSSGKMFLAPADCDPENLSATAIPVEWVHDRLATCKATLRLLVLDTCHSGLGLDASTLGASFGNLDRIVIIGSCKAAESSLPLADKEHSLFSFWLDQGLRGQADRELDGKIDIDELFQFVSRNVRRSAKIRDSVQTPIRIEGRQATELPAVLSLRPPSLKGMLADVAEQMAYAMGELNLKKVGVVEFLAVTPTGEEALGANYGLLGKYCAEELDLQLQDRSPGKFSVVDRRRLQESLSKSNFQLKDLGNGRRLESLSRSVDGLPVLAVGSLVSRDGRLLRLRCKLQQTGDDGELGVTPSGTATLNESEWAMLGRSVVVQIADRRPNLGSDAIGGASEETQVINQAEQRTQGPKSHPFQDPKFPFRVTMIVNGIPRSGEFRGNDYFVPVSKGEKYTLLVENKSGDIVVARILVDGLNTLPEKVRSSKGIVEGWGQHVNLNDARAWIFDPKAPEIQGKPPQWTVAGFAKTTGEKVKANEFVIVDAHNSLAASQSFSDEIGMITAAFYKVKSGPRGGGLGTAAGGEVTIDLKERAGITAGRLLGVAHVRYVDKKVLATTK